MTFSVAIIKSRLKVLIFKLRTSLIPSEHDKVVKAWFSEFPDESPRYDYDLDSSSFVMDLGGYKGQWASDIYSRYGCKIFIFEPVNSFAHMIESRFSRNPCVTVFRFALGVNARSESISLCGDSTSTYRNTASKDTILYKNVESFFSQYTITCVNLVKVNIEGGEYELLPQLIKSGLIMKIKNLQIQFHNFSADSEIKMNSICNDLRKTHSLTYRYKFVWENWVLNDSSY